MNRKIKTIAIVALSISPIASAEAVAEPSSEGNTPTAAEIEKVIEGASTQIRGDTTPDKVPLRSKLGALIRHYDRVHGQALEAELSDADKAVLQRAADSEQQATRDRRLLHKQSVTALCLDGQTRGAVELAEQLASLNKEANERQLGRYQETLSWVSKEGQQAIMEYVETSVTPGMVLTSFDKVQYARQYPDLFIGKFEDRCHYYRTGKHLPEVQAAIDRLIADQPDSDTAVIDAAPQGESASGSSVSAELDD